MKALVFSIKKFAVHDGDGIRSTVFLKGCPLRCRWCHNPEGISYKSELLYMQNKCVECGACAKACETGAHTFENGVHSFDREKCIACGRCSEVCLVSALEMCGREMTADEVVDAVLTDRAFYEASGGGVTLSGGECLSGFVFCAEVLEKLKEKGINCAVDTSGYVDKSAIDAVLPYTDTFLYDIKHIDSKKHLEFTGVSNVKILENLEYINSKGTDIEVRIPLIPTFNDDAAEEMGRFLSGLDCIKKVRVLPFNNLIGSKYEAVGRKCSVLDIPVPTNKKTDAFKHILKRYGLNVID